MDDAASDPPDKDPLNGALPTGEDSGTEEPIDAVALTSDVDTGEPSAPAAEAPYEFNAADITVAVQLVAEALADASDGWLAASAITDAAKARGLPPDSPLVRELVLACCYPLRLAPMGQTGCEFGPPYGAHTPWPSKPTAAVLRLWREVAAAATAPRAVARFEDLLFTHRDGNGRDRALRAAKAYMESTPPKLDLDGVEALVRAWSLARSVRLVDIEDRARATMAGHVQAILTHAPGEHAGVVLPMLAALAAAPVPAKRGDPARADAVDVDAMLTTAAHSFHKGYLASAVASLRRARTNDAATIEGINRDEVRAYLDEAHAAPAAAVRQHHLQAAATVARDRGLTDLARQATAEMERIKPSELGLQVIRAEGSVPRYVPEQWLSTFVRSPDWRDGLEVFLTTPPPTGNLADLRRAEEESRGGLRRIFTSTVLSSQWLPRATTRGDDDEIQHELAFFARVAAENMGRLLAEGLDRIAKRYGVPGEDELTVVLSRNGVCDNRIARNIARSFLHFWAGDFESCVHLAAPKVEAAAQSLLRELDEGVYQVQKGRDPGGYPGLHALLTELERLALDESWAFFLRWLLLGPYGANIRNEVAHGFLHEVPAGYAALVLRAAALLTTVAGPDGTGDAERRSRAKILSLLRDPAAAGGGSLAAHSLRWVSGVLERAWWNIEAARLALVRKSRRRPE